MKLEEWVKETYFYSMYFCMYLLAHFNNKLNKYIQNPVLITITPASLLLRE
jgi:hypothetical protein